MMHDVMVRYLIKVSSDQTRSSWKMSEKHRLDSNESEPFQTLNSWDQEMVWIPEDTR